VAGELIGPQYLNLDKLQVGDRIQLKDTPEVKGIITDILSNNLFKIQWDNGVMILSNETCSIVRPKTVERA
jgi:hypothetical protein